MLNGKLGDLYVSYKDGNELFYRFRMTGAQLILATSGDGYAIRPALYTPSTGWAFSGLAGHWAEAEPVAQMPGSFRLQGLRPKCHLRNRAS